MSWKNKENTEITTFPEKAVGIVYLMSCLKTGKKYVGKKGLWASKTYQKDGKKRKKKVESDWKNYYGSSPEFQKHIDLVGKEQIERVVLHICYSKAEMTYLETHEQFTRQVLLSDDYFNGWIMCRVTKPHLKKVRQSVLESIRPLGD